MQLVPLPRMKPLHPSSLHILPSAWPTDSLYASLPALWTCIKILSRSRGDTTVRETAPATPPAQKAATIGWEANSRNCFSRASLAALDGSTTSGWDWDGDVSGRREVGLWHRREGGLDIRQTWRRGVTGTPPMAWLDTTGPCPVRGALSLGLLHPVAFRCDGERKPRPGV